MKRAILIVILGIILSANLVSAQIQVGVVGGITSTEFYVLEDNPFEANPDDFKRQNDYGFGLAVEYSINQYFSIRTEPMFLRKSNIYEEEGSGTVPTYYLNYIELPLYFKAAYGKTLKPYVFAGPAIAYCVSAEADVDNSGILGTADIKHVLKEFDFAAKFGAGISYDFGFGTLFVQGIYSLGFTNINEGGEIEIDIQGFTVTEEIEALEVKLRGWQFLGGFQIPLGKK